MERKSDFRKRLQIAMTLKGKRAYEIAKGTGMSQASLSAYIKGTRSPKDSNIYAISQYLGVSPVWLMGFGDDGDELLRSEQTIKTKIIDKLDNLSEADLKKVLAFMENCL